MVKTFFLLFFFIPYSFALKEDTYSLIEHVGEVLEELTVNEKKIKCGSHDLQNRPCGPVIIDYLKDREKNWHFSLFVQENPREMCSNIDIIDRYYTSEEKLDNFFQEYTYGMIPSFKKINNQCFDKLSSMKEKNEAISYYYYAQMRILEDSLQSLSSMAAIDKKLGRPVLENVNCDNLGKAKTVCLEMKKCSSGKKQMHTNIANTQMALEILEKIENTKPKNSKEESEREQIIGGLGVLYPWINGKEFKKIYNPELRKDKKHIEKALTSQFLSTRKSLDKRLTSYYNLEKCIENESDDCDDFHEKLNELTRAPILGNNLNPKEIHAANYQHREACINNQRTIRNNANELMVEFAISSGLTVATMGLGAVAQGSGHVVKGVVAGQGANLSRMQRIRNSVSAFSLKQSKNIKNSARYLAYLLNGSFVGLGLKDTVKQCRKDLNHLTEYKRLTAKNYKPTLCPLDEDNPEFQLMEDIKACAINAALSSIDFLPAIPYGVQKFSAMKKDFNNSKIHQGYKEDTLKNLDPYNVREGDIQPEDLQAVKMKDSYKGENIEQKDFLVNATNERMANGKPLKTKYLYSKKMRDKFKVHYRDGKLYNSFGAPINTVEGYGSYIVDMNGDLYLTLNPRVSRFHHSSFMAGEDVLSAGQIEVKNGKVTVIDRSSGHYKPTEYQAYQGLYFMLKNGIDLSKAEVDFYR